ncbi:MAG: class I SAM-dependent methyltransferase [Beijerinckiaceae bacterium]
MTATDALDMTWRDYWNENPPVYVSERHKILHDARVAQDIARLIPPGGARVLDHGCGEARSAGEVARRCARLYLCDGAPAVLSRVRERFAHEPKIETLAPEEIETLIADQSLDMVVANSLAQYLSREELSALLDLWRRKLKAGGRLIVGDVVPPDVGPLTDARALLSFAAQGGFLMAAVAGLVRTAFSRYSALRSEIGLTTYSEADMVVVLKHAGFEPKRWSANIGHNQARMTFAAGRLE